MSLLRTLVRRAVVGMMTVGLLVAGAGGASAQGDDPNTGSITLTSGVDFLPGSVYIFRGIVQESDPKLTLWPYGDVGLSLYSGEGGLKSASVNFGVWNSLHTGSSGSDGLSEKLHYEMDFYAGFTLGFGGGTSINTTYTAYTSPNFMFGTVKEISFKVSVAHLVAPYVLIARELDGAADGGTEGTYVELGIGPSWALADGKVTVAIPVKLGLSASDYYEHFGDADHDDGEDHKFGFLDVGVLFTVPLSGIPASFGAWNFHAGIDVFAFGDTTKDFNGGDKGKVTGLFGFGVSY